jgi:putative transposase
VLSGNSVIKMVWSYGQSTYTYCTDSPVSIVGLNRNPPGTVYLLHAHLGFGTKRRGKVFSAAHLKRLEQICRSLCADFEVTLKQFNGEPDHLHLLVTYPPKVRLSEWSKGVSSRLIKQELPACHVLGCWQEQRSSSGPRAISWVR